MPDLGSFWAIPLLLLLVAVVAYLLARDDEPAAQPSGFYGRGLLLTNGVPQVPHFAAELLDLMPSQRPNEIDEEPEPVPLVVVDASALDDIPSGYLKNRLRTGAALMGINVPLAKLIEVSSFIAVIEEQSFTGSAPASLLSLGPEIPEPYYSLLWTSQPGVVPFRSGANAVAIEEDEGSEFQRDLVRCLLGVKGNTPESTETTASVRAANGVLTA